jgi:chloramphenicol 3-O phosphotransferase
VTAQIIVLNGGSSSGKTEIARGLQVILPDPWLRLSVDDLVDALPPALLDSGTGIAFGSRGEVTPGSGFQEIEAAWLGGIASMVQAGVRVIYDDVFLRGGACQQRLRERFEGIDVLWVGVHCNPEVAASRERARGDRTLGMAAAQAEAVHQGVAYDLEVDTSNTPALDCARIIAVHIA